jgi:sugar phosphate isomerase/epimerase
MVWSPEKIQVNIPFRMLKQSYLESFLDRKLNPEIGLDAIALDQHGFSDFKEVADKLHKRGLRITLHGPFMDMSPGSPDPAVKALTRKRFEQVVALVPLFKPASVVFHAGYDEKRYGYDAVKEVWLANSLEMWSWLGWCLHNEGSLLMLENVYEHYPGDMQILLDRLGGEGVGFCLDTGHQAAFGHASLKEWVDVLGPYVGQLHLHDNLGRKDEHLALGEGKTDFEALFTDLRRIKETPPIVTLEPHKEQDFIPSLRYLERCWPW